MCKRRSFAPENEDEKWAETKIACQQIGEEQHIIQHTHTNKTNKQKRNKKEYRVSQEKTG